MSTPRPTHTSTAALLAVRVLLVLSLLCALSQLAGCGGGGDDDPTAHITPPDCQAHPEACR